MELLLSILVGIVIAATPLVLAAIGELVVEKSGVLNLGVEGMMIVGAVAGFARPMAAEAMPWDSSPRWPPACCCACCSAS